VCFHQDGNRGTPARSQPDQTLAATLQCAVTRRQVFPVYPDHLGSLGTANTEASWRPHEARALLWAFRFSWVGQPNDQCAGTRIPVAILLGFIFRSPDETVPAPSDQALLGALHRRDRFCRLHAAGN